MDCYAATPDHLKPLLTFLLRPDLTLVRCLCAVAPKATIDSISFAVVNLFETSGRSMDLLSFMIDHEFSVCNAPNNLFRDNTFSSKSLSAYNKIVTVSYLRKTLRPLVYSLYYTDAPLELELSKLGPNETVEENVKNITAVVQMFMVKIFRSIEMYPLSCRFICHQLMAKAKKHFPQEIHLPYSLAGTFFFLRFICPAIVFPDKCGVWDLEVPPPTRRALTLISKILQRLTIRAESSASKEDLAPMKDFFAEQSEKGTMKMFFDLMGTPPVLEEIKFAYSFLSIHLSAFLYISMNFFLTLNFSFFPFDIIREEITIVQPDVVHINSFWEQIKNLQGKIDSWLDALPNKDASDSPKKEFERAYNIGLGLMLPPKY
jgi:hypothetical protein